MKREKLRWWLAAVILGSALIAVLWIYSRQQNSFQERNIWLASVLLATSVALFIWWVVTSRLPLRRRMGIAAVVVIAGSLCATLFRWRGVSGDLVPILEPRWRSHPPMAASAHSGGKPAASAWKIEGSFPQFLGPNRNAILDGPSLATNWEANPPQVLWRKQVGPSWSGFAVVGAFALTQEQRPEGESTTCYDLRNGELLWSVAEPVHYHNPLAGEGPRCTPTVAGSRVLTLGATGVLNCLDLQTGRRLWRRDIVLDAKSAVPEWGVAGSPLVCDGTVVVSGGGNSGLSLLAYRLETGELAWSGGSQRASYSSPVLASLAGTRQILAFNHRKITAHDPTSGRVLWDYPWGDGQPQAAAPLVVGPNRVVFSSGYGVGSQLLEIGVPSGSDLFPVRSVWQSRKMKAKFANLVHRNGFLYGLDDGVFACVDLQDGSQRWKEGRYGHGQGLLINDLFLLMAENGELVLLQPTPEAPHELARFKLFTDKTWNPIALAGDLLLARNDQQAVCVRLKMDPAGK